MGLLGRRSSPYHRTNQAADLLFNASDASPMNLYIIDKDTRVTTAPTNTYRILDYTVKIQTNELGLLCPAPPKFSTDTPHWIAVGDSFTMSVQVDHIHLSGQLLPSLEHRYGTRCRRLFYLASHPSSTNQRALQSNVPLTFFTGNDFQDNERLAMQRSPYPVRWFPISDRTSQTQNG